MKLNEYIEKLLKERDKLYEEEKIVNEKRDEELKEIDKKIEDNKLLVSNLVKVLNKYSCLDVEKVGYYICKLMSDIENYEYVLHRAKVIYNRLYYDYGKYNTVTEEGTIYMISPKDDVKDKYEVKYYAEYQKNPLAKSDHILFDVDKEFYFYDYTFRERYFTRYPYIKEFVDNIIDAKYELDMGITNEDENKIMLDTYEDISNKYKAKKYELKYKSK